MKGLLQVIVLALLLARLDAAFVEPGLPAWGEGERKKLEETGWVAGGVLLSKDPIPEMKNSEQASPLDVDGPSVEEIAQTESLADFLPEKFWPAYFDEHPKNFLIDPQGLLSQSAYRDRLGFLNYHAGDSSIDLFVYVFKGNQYIPGEVRDEELIERFFMRGRPAAIVYYYMGAPQRSALFLSPSLTDAVSTAEQHRALESSIMQAFGKLDHTAQMEAFLVQISIRIYWMERIIGGEQATAANEPAGQRSKNFVAEKPSKLEKFRPLLDSAIPHVIPAAAMIGVLLLGMMLSKLMKLRACYRFPDLGVEPRLGGAHCAGVGAVISFASAAVPPASQRDQVPDYLRRA
ncbi:MAG: hypothetical protein H8M99_00135 [Gloeobacteraceae cyanobacterium ES-bin-144]|nr:hypothetical protein [Verrucomicrobiales bacterium]